ncbi:hypothetical protein NXF25_010486, partial [Crotalus adamanteus]
GVLKAMGSEFSYFPNLCKLPFAALFGQKAFKKSSDGHLTKNIAGVLKLI